MTQQTTAPTLGHAATVNAWMAWEGGVDLLAMSGAGAAQPDIIVHFARMVHTPVGSAPSGMIMLPGGEGGQPRIAGFVSENEALARYFGPTVFAGTPFEGAPALVGRIQAEFGADNAHVRVEVAGIVVETEMRGFGPLASADRVPGNLPFHDRSLEAAAGSVILRVDGAEVSVVLPPTGMSGGPPAVWSPAGIYWR